jgi:hypothetical protein
MRQVNWTRQLGLSAVLLVLGTAAYWLEFKHKPEEEAKEEQSKKIFKIKDVAVQKIRMVDGKTVFSFVCSDFGAKLCKPSDVSKWEISEPSKLKGDDTNLNTFLTTLSNLGTTDTLDLKTETSEKRQAMLRDYGLDAEARKSTRKVELITAAGSTTLYLGQTHPIGNLIFALIENSATGAIDENQVYTIPSFFKSNFDHDLTYWRNKKLLTLAAHEVETFDLKGTKGHVQGKRVKGIWSLQGDGEKDLPGDTEAIDNLLTGTTYLVAKNFVSDDKKDAKAKTAMTGFVHLADLTLQKEKGTEKEPSSPITLTLYKKDKKGPKKADPITSTVYATVSNLDPLFELESYSKERIDKSLKDLRQTKLISSMDRFSAKRIEFSGPVLGTTPMTLENNGGKWFSLPSKEEIPADKLQDTLEKLSGNRIKDFLTGPHIPTGEEQGLKFTLHGDKDVVQRQLVFWKKGDRLYGKDLMGRRNEAFLVDSLITEALPWEKTFFSKKNESKTPKKSDKTEE